MTMLKTASGTLGFRQCGAGAPVIMLHGSASDGDQWRSLAGCVGGRFRAIMPDLPGYGGSDPVAPPSRATLAEVAGQIALLADHCGEQVHLVGHGFGGAVALRLAASAPARVRSLTLIEPWAFHLLRGAGLSDRRLLTATEEVQDALASAVCAGDPEAGMRRFVDFWNGDGAWFRSSDRLCRAMTAAAGQVLNDLAALAVEPGPREASSVPACPTLCIMGRASPAVARRVTRIVAAMLPAARLQTIADAGHMAPLTDPHLVDPMIRAHLLASDGAPARAVARIAA